MHLSFLLPLLGIAAFAVYKIASIISAKWQNAAKARQLGCQPAPELPNQGLLGYKHMKMLMAADAKMQIPEAMIERQEIMSKAVGYHAMTFKTNILGQTIYFTSDPKNIQAMLATQFNEFEIGPIRAEVMGYVLGDGIFVQDGKKWEHSRAMLRPNFVREQVSDLDMEERHVQDLMTVMPTLESGWTDFTNIQQLFFRLTIDAATEFLFGESCNSQLSEAGFVTGQTVKDHDERLFSQNFDTAQLHMAKKFRFGDQHWLHSPKEFKENARIVNDFVKHYVDLALKKTNNGDLKEKSSDSQKEKYVFLEAVAQQTQDPVELRAQMLNILLAGRDTTASLLSWTFYELVRHPDIFQKLRETIIDEFGTYENPTNITFASLKSCQYLQYTLNESLRYWSVVPGNGRRTNKPTTLPRGGGPDGESPIFLPADTQVDYSIHVMHRNKDIWGPDADQFKPERFYGRKSGWEFLPFNGGPRICIGQQFAITEASYVMVRLLQRFDQLEAPPGELELPATTMLTLTSCPGRPVTLRLHEAKA